ncbi:hypothetical protein CH255_20340 [Rhodococcus sp. 05-2255-2A2]|nr:hypothetical protein CH250_17275 [Rhodococcus sp. 05-2255-3C]OZE16815.1 hypothetical protein CH255_20340 [Rhodococcus sp. 05-2255-2A2]
MWWQIGGAVALAAVLASNEFTRRSTIMAVGIESAKAIAEVREAVAAEVDQAATKIIEATGADADTAAEIRTLLAPVKGIIPDEAVEGGAGDTGGTLEPGESGVNDSGQTEAVQTDETTL